MMTVSPTCRPGPSLRPPGPGSVRLSDCAVSNTPITAQYLKGDRHSHCVLMQVQYHDHFLHPSRPAYVTTYNYRQEREMGSDTSPAEGSGQDLHFALGHFRNLHSEKVENGFQPWHFVDTWQRSSSSGTEESPARIAGKTGSQEHAA
jgi:hypothetical protein